MYKQLIHYLPNNTGEAIVPVIVETSPELEAAGIEEWERAAFAKHSTSTIPFGHQWSIIDQNHVFFDSSKLPVIPVNFGRPGALLTPEEISMRERTREMQTRFSVE